ncbi:MAG: hypothetical protein IH934_01825 [Nanoarchaeota archaeon]|nr:hypothetical protein [Nanoarchaeota archaeon]
MTLRYKNAVSQDTPGTINTQAIAQLEKFAVYALSKLADNKSKGDFLIGNEYKGESSIRNDGKREYRFQYGAVYKIRSGINYFKIPPGKLSFEKMFKNSGHRNYESYLVEIVTQIESALKVNGLESLIPSPTH